MEGSIHQQVVVRSVELLRNSGQAALAAWASQYFCQLCDGVLYADRAGTPLSVVVTVRHLCGVAEKELVNISCGNTSSCTHYHDPLTGTGLNLRGMKPLELAAGLFLDLVLLMGTFPIEQVVIESDLDFNTPYSSAVVECQRHYQRALDAWNGDTQYWSGLTRREAAMRELGWACHFITDLCTAPHTNSRPSVLEFIGHKDYESFATQWLTADNALGHASTIEPSALDLASSYSA